MFSSITWNEFLTCTGSIIVIYYTLSAPWLFRHEIKKRLQNKNTSTTDESPYAENTMGLAQTQRLESIAQRLEEEEPVFTATVTPLPAQETIPNNETRIINLISALLLEANTLASVIAGSAGTKDDTDSMFRSMLENYSELLQSPYRNSVNVFLLNACVKEGLPVTANQVESWWTSSTPSE